MHDQKNYSEKGSNSNIFFLVIAIIILITGVVFALNNSHEVQVRFLGLHLESSLAAVIMVTFVLGIAIGVFTLLANIFKRDKVIAYQARDINDLEAENEELKSELANIHKEKPQGKLHQPSPSSPEKTRQFPGNLPDDPDAERSV